MREEGGTPPGILDPHIRTFAIARDRVEIVLAINRRERFQRSQSRCGKIARDAAYSHAIGAIGVIATSNTGSVSPA